MGTDNNPEKTLSRLIHKDNSEYFSLLDGYQFHLFSPKIEAHISKCRLCNGVFKCVRKNAPFIMFG